MAPVFTEIVENFLESRTLTATTIIRVGELRVKVTIF